MAVAVYLSTTRLIIGAYFSEVRSRQVTTSVYIPLTQFPQCSGVSQFGNVSSYTSISTATFTAVTPSITGNVTFTAEFTSGVGSPTTSATSTSGSSITKVGIYNVILGVAIAFVVVALNYVS